MADVGVKVAENLCRRMAERQGYALHKSRRRDRRAVDYGRFWLLDPRTDGVVYPVGSAREVGATLEEIGSFLGGAL